MVPTTKSTDEEESANEKATSQVQSAVEDKTRMKRCNNWSNASLQ